MSNAIRQYAAPRHLAPESGVAGAALGSAEAAMPWELDAERSPARQETWLLSFIDILALLLTLFVLLLAFQDRGNTALGSGPTEQPAVAVDWLALLVPQGVDALSAPEMPGYAMPGNGLVPLSGAPVETAADVATPPVKHPTVKQNIETPVKPAAATEQQPAETRDPGAPVKPFEQEPAVAVQVVAAPPIAVPTVKPHTTDAVPTAAATPANATTANQFANESAPQPGVASTEVQAAAQLLNSLQTRALEGRVEVASRPGAVDLVIRDSVLFAPASAALSTQGQVLLDQLAEILLTLPYSVSVEGHTDNVPIHTAQYPSNWELSTARASRVTRQLIDRGVAAERLRAIGYGDTRPRQDNNSPATRAQNRRVTFVLQVE